jgi:hypothetical protein
MDATATGVLTIRSLMSRPKRSKASIIDSYTLKLFKEITLHTLYHVSDHLEEFFLYQEPAPEPANHLLLKKRKKLLTGGGFFKKKSTTLSGPHLLLTNR